MALNTQIKPALNRVLLFQYRRLVDCESSSSRC